MAGSMAQDFEDARRLYPHLAAPDLIEGITFAAKNGTSLKEYAAKVARETEQLNKLEHALGMAEIAQTLLDLVGPEAIGTALSRIQQKNEGTLSAAMNKVELTTTTEEDEDMELEEELIDAYDNEDVTQIAELMERIKHNRMVRLGLHRTPVSDSRSPIQASSRKFKKLVASQGTDDADIRRMAAQNAHVSEDERTIDFEGSLELNEGATFLLRQKIAQRQKDADDEENRSRETRGQTVARVRSRVQSEGTKASDTIRAHGEPDPKSVAALLPKSWTNPFDETPAMSAGDIDTKSSLPSEFAPQSAQEKLKAGAMKTWTDAAKTIDKGRPAFTQNNYLNDQGNVSPNRPEAKAAPSAAAIRAADTYSQAGMKKTQQKQYQANLDSLTSPRPDGT
jgi:hypothetical protein